MGEPKSKGYCSRGCVIWAKRIGLINSATRRGRSNMEKGETKEDGYGIVFLDKGERDRCFNRFKSAYEDFVEKELLIERFGEWYYEWEPQMKEESRLLRRKKRKEVNSKDSCKCPEMPMLGLRLKRSVREAA